MLAQPFDVRASRVTGEAIAIADEVGYDVTRRSASFSVSAGGTLVYAHGAGRIETKLTWVDRTGKNLGVVGESGQYSNIALSPDETRVAASMTAGSPPNRDIWVIDARRPVTDRITNDPAVEANPAWSPDGQQIAYTGSQPPGLHVRNSTGSGRDDVLLPMEGIGGASDWSRDGRYILYWHIDQKAAGDLWIVPTAGDRKPIPFATSSFNEQDGAFSPDTRWVTYASDETGRLEVWVQPFPATGMKYRISTGGGEQPMWRADGKELFYLSPDSVLMRVSIDLKGGPQAPDIGPARPLFSTGILMSNRRQYAVARDGQRFLLNVAEHRSNPTSLNVILNWRPMTNK
jgi:Tol biopolymer transport system component